MLRRTSRLVALPMRHAARTAATASRLSRATAEEVATRGVEQAFATLGELRGGAVKLGQAFSLFEAAMPAEVAGPYRSAVNRLSEATPGMPAAVVWRVVTGDLSLAYGSSWRDRLVDFDDAPAAAASIGQVHRGRWRDDSGDLVDVAVKVQYPRRGQGVAFRRAHRADTRPAGGPAHRLGSRLVHRRTGGPDARRGWTIRGKPGCNGRWRLLSRGVCRDRRAAARPAGVREPPGRTRVVVPHVYAATPRVLVSRWLDGVPLTALLDGGTDQLPVGWQGLERAEAADLAGRLIGHAGYAPASCTGWMHADPHPGNFLLLPGGRLGLVDFGSVAAMPDGIPEPLGRLAAAVLAADAPATRWWARRAGLLAPAAGVELIDFLRPVVAAAAEETFTYSPEWWRALLTHLAAPRFAPVRKQLHPPREYALIWRGVLSVASLYAGLGATVPTRGFEAGLLAGIPARREVKPMPPLADARAGRMDPAELGHAGARARRRRVPPGVSAVRQSRRRRGSHAGDIRPGVSRTAQLSARHL
jgi:hypothetical protein